jgi:hypothetical protein
MDFDEQNAIDYIREHLPDEYRDKYDDDEILNVIDIIFDYYDESGMLDIDLSDEDEDDVDVEELVKYVTKVLRKDKLSPIAEEHIKPIVLAELDYEQTLDI